MSNNSGRLSKSRYSPHCLLSRLITFIFMVQGAISSVRVLLYKIFYNHFSYRQMLRFIPIYSVHAGLYLQIRRVLLVFWVQVLAVVCSNGTTIQDTRLGLGYVLGDEGSGAVLGEKFALTLFEQ